MCVYVVSIYESRLNVGIAAIRSSNTCKIKQTRQVKAAWMNNLHHKMMKLIVFIGIQIAIGRNKNPTLFSPSNDPVLIIFQINPEYI